MHPRSVYNHEPDFGELAQEYDSFKQFVQVGPQGRSYIDFKNALAVKELCICLLKRDFGLTIDFPVDTLCPAVPNRLNYILWLEDLLEDTLPPEEKKIIRGIDIGIGASCIYPLLGCSINENWAFIGTEINEKSIDCAKDNIKRNHLENRISIKHNVDPEKIFFFDIDTTFAFSMCNPPFYANREEVDQGLLNKELEPSAVCTGSNNEMITKGGEYAFIKLMVLESLTLQKKIRWYTSMIGLKRTIRPLIRLLNDHGISNYTVTSFTQGKTVRWAIAWSFYADRPVKAHAIEAWRPVYQFEIKLPEKLNCVLQYAQAILDDLEIEYSVDDSDMTDITVSCHSRRNTWSRSARRLKKRQKLEKEPVVVAAIADQELFKFDLQISASRSGSNTYLLIKWLEGGTKTSFEGFWSHFKKRIEEQCGIQRGTSFSK